MDILHDLEFRELIYQCTDKDELAGRLNSGPIVLYIGFDPTADSLHVGNLLPILGLRRFQMAGHKPIALVGGGTGLIGDPSGKTAERALNEEDIIYEWTAKIRAQLERFLDFESPGNAARLVNNYQWLGGMEVIKFLREIGRHFPVGYMLSKESVKARISETGISYTEFSYMILQAYDYYILNRDYNCELQAGGSDQWGNITAGTDLIRRASNRRAYGITFPLVTKEDGTKFGKTEAGTIWLDPDKTLPYSFYQFWFNTDDRDVIQFIKYFTFMTKDEIVELQGEVENNPHKREAQRVLAREVTALVHGKEAVSRVEKISAALFYGNLAELSKDELEEGFKNVPSVTIDNREKTGVVDLLVSAGICPSKRQAREDIKNRAIFINDQCCTQIDRELLPSERWFGKYIVVRRGKKNYHLVRWL